MEDILVPIMITLGFFAMVFGVVYMYKKESLAMIDKGMNPRQPRSPQGPRPFRYLKWGVLLVGAGMGLLAAYLLDWLLPERNSDPIYFALIAIGGGVGLIISYKMEMKALKEIEGREIHKREISSPPMPSEL